MSRRQQLEIIKGKFDRLEDLWETCQQDMSRENGDKMGAMLINIGSEVELMYGMLAQEKLKPQIAPARVRPNLRKQ